MAQERFNSKTEPAFFPATFCLWVVLNLTHLLSGTLTSFPIKHIFAVHLLCFCFVLNSCLCILIMILNQAFSARETKEIIYEMDFIYTFFLKFI